MAIDFNSNSSLSKIQHNTTDAISISNNLVTINKPSKIEGLQSFANDVTVASATTLDLTSANSNNIIISGSDPISAITMPEGAEITAIFTGAVPFVNSANLVLPNGKNATAKAGDIVLLRRVGLVVSVIVLQPAPKSIINVAGSRVIGVNYTNDRLYPITVSYTNQSTNTGARGLQTYIDGVFRDFYVTATANTGLTAQFDVPSGSQYRIENTGVIGFTDNWTEEK